MYSWLVNRLVLYIGEREILEEPEGGFSPYHFAIVMEVTFKIYIL